MCNRAFKLILGILFAFGTVRPILAEEKAAPPDPLKIAGLPEQNWTFTLDWQAMTAAVLGPDWAERSAAEQEEFSNLMFQLIERVYGKHRAHLAGSEIEMSAEERRSDGLIMRKFIARSQKPGEDPIEYSLLLKLEKDAWSAQDIVTEGVSLVASYRSQFRKILKNEGFAVLIQKMKAKVERDRAAVR